MKDPLRDARAWVHQAEVDLAAAERLTDGFAALACFHAQQAAEKALKAILYATGKRPVLGHSLGDLSRQVLEVATEFETISSEVSKLDRFYIPTRYPNGLPEGGNPSEAFDEADAGAAIASAARALQFATTFIDRS